MVSLWWPVRRLLKSCEYKEFKLLNAANWDLNIWCLMHQYKSSRLICMPFRLFSLTIKLFIYLLGFTAQRLKVCYTLLKGAYWKTCFRKEKKFMIASIQPWTCSHPIDALNSIVNPTFLFFPFFRTWSLFDLCLNLQFLLPNMILLYKML